MRGLGFGWIRGAVRDGTGMRQLQQFQNILRGIRYTIRDIGRVAIGAVVTSCPFFSAPRAATWGTGTEAP